MQDVARSNINALKSEIRIGNYNVGTGVQTSVKQLCNIILKLKKSDLNIKYKPYGADDARQLVQNRIGSTEKAEKEIGFKYKYSLKEGLNLLIKWREKKI